jgi:AcrR family transcriptional regulator
MLDSGAPTGPSARRERGRREMRLAIIDTASKIIADEGIDRLTIRAVATRLGYSPGALYEYFDSKDAILAGLYFEGTDGLGARCERAVADLPAGASAIDALMALGHAYRTFALEHADLYRLVFGGFKTPPQPESTGYPDASRGGFGTLVQVAQRGVEEGVFIDLPAPVIAVAAWSAVHGFVSLELSRHLTGGDGPGMPQPSQEEGRQRRDRMFGACAHGPVRVRTRGVPPTDHLIGVINAHPCRPASCPSPPPS